MKRSEIANRYNKRYTKTICVRLNIKTDRDILERLNQVGNKCGYIKQLIREDGKDEKNKLLDAMKVVHNHCEKNEYCTYCSVLEECHYDLPEFWKVGETE